MKRISNGVKRLQDFSFQGKRVLLRCDFNVPLDAKRNIADDFRIKEVIPTIEYLLSHCAKVVLMSHLGEPAGKRVEHLALGKVQEKLLEYLDSSITKAKDCIGKDIEAWTFQMQEGEILLLENLRFHKEEEENGIEFAAALSKLGDIYINDAFSVSHRNHASVAGVPTFLPCGIGLLFERELGTLKRFRSNPARPFLVIVGGKKAENKLSFIDAISEIADAVLIGNLLIREKERLAQSFNGAPRVHRGANPLSSFKNPLSSFRNPLSSFRNPLKVVLPLDGELDIGPKTLELFTRHIQKAKSIFWTGPLGQVEKEEYTKGSLAIAKAIGESKAFSVAGGGDLIGFLRSHHLEDKFSYLSSAGGAALAFLAGEKLPGLEALGYYGS